MILELSLESLASLVGGRIKQSNHHVSPLIRGVSIDTRTLDQDDLFIAIKGPRFDGHDYVAQASLLGANVALTERWVADAEISQVVVSDTTRALGQLGAANRAAFSGTVAGITGSCGKTSVKEILMEVFSGQGSTMATEGNLNNELGVPLTLLRIGGQHQYAVVEMGTSSPGEISYIAGLATPDVSLITNADEAHLADLIDVAGVAYEKGFILDSLRPGGIAVLNKDDRFYQQWRDRVAARAGNMISFSLSDPTADCYASDIVSTISGMQFNLHIHEQCLAVNLSFWGKHQVVNACCAAAAAFACGIPLAVIVSGLEKARTFRHRGQRYTHHSGALLIDESYNANPRATIAAVEQLVDCGGTTIMVFGDMLDLGDVSDQRHRDVGYYAYDHGVSHFISFGSSAKLASEAFGNGLHFEEKTALINWLEGHLAEGVSVLVKGSKLMKMFDVLEALVGSDYEGET